MLDAAIDHVAVAVRSIAASLPFFVDALGAQFLMAGDQPEQGFRWAQFRFPGGGKLELVTSIAEGSFVERFIEGRGEGVHHVTLKVPDIERALAHLEAEGTPVFNVSLDGPEWREAFIHPKDGHGVLVQIAQSSWSDEQLAAHHLSPHDESSHRHLSLEDLREDPARA